MSIFSSLAGAAGSLLLPGVGGLLGGLFDSDTDKEKTGANTGGALGSIGSTLIQGLTDAFSVTDGGSGLGSGANGDDLNKLLNLSYYTPSGYTGEDAKLESQRAKSQLLNVNNANAVRRGNMLEQTGVSALASADRSAGLARQTGIQQLGQQRREGVDTVRAAGGPIAAIAKMGSVMGDASGRMAGNIGGASAAAYANALNTANQSFASAEDVRTKDLMTNNQIFDRRAMSPNNNVGSLAGTIAQRDQWNNQNKLLEDTWGPAKALAGLHQGAPTAGWLWNTYYPDQRNKFGKSNEYAGPMVDPKTGYTFGG